jgi:hypothetical protein
MTPRAVQSNSDALSVLRKFSSEDAARVLRTKPSKEVLGYGSCSCHPIENLESGYGNTDRTTFNNSSKRSGSE